MSTNLNYSNTIFIDWLFLMQHISNGVVKSAKLKGGVDITLMNDETLEVIECKIKKSTRKPPEFSIEGVWYQFALNLNLTVRDTLVFGPPTLLHVVALRNFQQPNS